MAEASGVNDIVVQPEELKFMLSGMEGKLPSSFAMLTNPTALPVAFFVEVPATDPDNYEVKPSCGIVPAFGDCIINVTARGLPPVEHQEREISVRTFDVPPGWGENLVFPEKHYPLRHHAPDHAITRHATCMYFIRVRWVYPKIEISTLMNKAAGEVIEHNLGLALETLGEVIKFHPDGYSLLSRSLVKHRLGQEEGAKRDLQDAERQFSNSERAKGTREPASSVAYCIISDICGVPIYTTEKLCGKQMIVDRSVRVTDNQQLDVDVRFTPSIKLRSDGNVELNVVVNSLRYEIGNPQAPDPDHYVQSLQIVVRPTGDWSESDGFDLIAWKPGNERNLEVVQQGRSLGFSAGMNVGASPSAVLQLNRNNISGTTFPAYGFKPSTRVGHAYVCEHELRTFKNGFSTENLEAVKRKVNYPDLGEEYAGTWTVPFNTATELRNEFKFTISVKAKLPVVRKCKNICLPCLGKTPEPEVQDQEVEIDRTCVFAIARLKSFTAKRTAISAALA